jgi:hypothetical protein
VFEGLGRYQHAWVPTEFAPVTVPYPRVHFPPFSTLPTRKNLVVTSLAVPRPDDLYRPGDHQGRRVDHGQHAELLRLRLRKARPHPAHARRAARARVDHRARAPGGRHRGAQWVLRGNVYFIESWRIGKVTPDGTVVTLAGHRHKDIASYYADPTSAELVGDWSSIPPDRRGFAQPWGMAWDARTLEINQQ